MPNYARETKDGRRWREWRRRAEGAMTMTGEEKIDGGRVE
jgi:hypothetical protein